MASEETKRELAKYRDRVGASRFFDDRVNEMDREELLGLVGWLCADMERAKESRDSVINMYRLAAKSRYG